MADERGSIVSVTNASGAILAINSYDEYGIPGTSNIGRFQYTGQVWLPEVGLYHYKARMYSPTLGRFMQTDPIGYADGMNWYAYVGNDPISRVDHLGHAAQRHAEDLLDVSQEFRDQGVHSMTYAWGNLHVDAPEGTPCLAFGGPCENNLPNRDQQTYGEWIYDRVSRRVGDSFIGRAADWVRQRTCDATDSHLPKTAPRERSGRPPIIGGSLFELPQARALSKVRRAARAAGFGGVTTAVHQGCS